MEGLNKHPKALPFLFLTEMWERFGFYVVQGLLVLYVTEYFGWTDSDSYTILGVFTALAYISPLAGGFLANKLLGFSTAIIWGGFFLVIGYALLALPQAEFFLYPALATIIVGNGLFKPNISSLLGMQYEQNDPRRDAGFTIFYIGINIGAFLAGASAGYIKEYVGWRMSFALASMGLIIGLATFIYGLRFIRQNGSAQALTSIYFRFFLYCVLAIVGINFLLRVHALSTWLLPSAGFVLLMVLVVLTLQQDDLYRKRLFILNILILASIVFWMLFLQIFSSANLFVERLVDKNFWGIHLTTTIFWASESIFIILMGPFFAWMWQALGARNRNPSPVAKFALGILFAGFGFTVLALSTYYPNAEGLVGAGWIFFAYFLITIGELLLSPIGLSAVTLLSPSHLVGLMMGVWFVATGFGGIFSGMLARLASIPDNVFTTADKLAIYQAAFFDYAYIAFIVAIGLFFLQLFLRRMVAAT